MKLAVAMLLSSTVSSLAAGAFAVGSTGDVARDGFSFGIATEHASDTEARTIALDKCRNKPINNPRARARCELVTTFHDKCVALAMDPKNGTPGVGWAVADTSAEAKEQAMAACKATAGRDRREFCAIDSVKCDGKSP